MTFFKFSSRPLVSFLSPRFILWLAVTVVRSHPVMVIYLVGKGLLFLTRREFRQNEAGKFRREEQQSEHTQGRWNRKYIIAARLPGDNDCLPRSSNGTEALATDSERRRGKKELHVNICSHRLPG